MPGGVVILPSCCWHEVPIGRRERVARKGSPRTCNGRRVDCEFATHNDQPLILGRHTRHDSHARDSCGHLLGHLAWGVVS